MSKDREPWQTNDPVPLGVDNGIGDKWQHVLGIMCIVSAALGYNLKAPGSFRQRRHSRRNGAAILKEA